MPGPSYSMPPVAQGDIVLWRHNVGSLDSAPAIVVEVGQFGIAVVMFSPGSRQGTIRDGVRHCSDPALKTVISSDTGVWDYTDTHKRLLALFNAWLAAEAAPGRGRPAVAASAK
jgi:hypothetical protein